MSLSKFTDGRTFRGLSLLVAAATGYLPCSLGFDAIGESIAGKVQQFSRGIHSHYTVAPGMPYLGKHPGRDPGRGVWSKMQLAGLTSSTPARTIRAFGGGGGGGPAHSLAVSPAPGNPYAWEGSGPSAAGQVNTANGDKLTAIPLVSWTSGYGMTVDFTVYQNSQSNFNDSLGYGWTNSTDVYINNLGSSPVTHFPDGLSVPYTTSGSSYVPPAGVYDQLVKNGDSTWTLTHKDGSKIQFNTSGYMVSESDRNGNTVTYTLNADYYCTKITGPDGKYLTINLNGSNQITSIVDPLGDTWDFTINGSSDLTEIAWPELGADSYNDQFTYTAHAIVSHTDRRGKVWTASYNSDNSIATESDPLSNEVSYSYTASATTITDPLTHSRVDNYSSGVLASSEDESSYTESYTSRDANYNVDPPSLSRATADEHP